MEGRASKNPSHTSPGLELNNLDPGDSTTRGSQSTFHQQRLGSFDRAEPSPPVNRRTLRSWWSNNVCPTITHNSDEHHPHNNDPRDYLALERTYLAHIRTASALVSFGVALVQLFRLKNVESQAGIILAAATAGGGVVMVLTGGRRYFLQQKLLLHGRTLAGGAAAWIDGILVLGIVAAVLLVVLAGASE